MRITFTLLFMLSVSFYSFGQTDTLNNTQYDFNKSLSIYELAKQFNDPVIERMALYELILITENQSQLLDSLALSYYSSSNYVSAAIVAQENLKLNKRNEISLEVGAISLSNLGAKDKALELFETLALVNNNNKTYYKVAALQYELNRLNEATSTVNILMEKENIDTEKILFPKADKANQSVSMRAALHNLRGLISEAEGKGKAAQNHFLKALEIQPDFEVVQINIQRVRKAANK